MRNFTLIILFTGIFASQVSWGQEAGLIRAGGGLAMGTASSLNDSGESALGFGITLTGDYFITDKITISPAYTFFFKSTYGDPSILELSTSASSLDFDGKYYFLTEDVKVYGLFGLTFGFAKVSITTDLGNGPQTVSDTGSEFGINIGGGADFYFNETTFFNAQMKYNTPLAQLAINLGIGFNF